MTTPIADFVRAYAASGGVRLHMPGHKGRSFLGCEALDITEVAGADSLYEASGIIAESEENAATSKAVKTVMDEAKSRAKITVGDTAPEDAQEGDFWFDTSDTPDSASDAQEEKAPPSAE